MLKSAEFPLVDLLQDPFGMWRDSRRFLCFLGAKSEMSHDGCLLKDVQTVLKGQTYIPRTFMQFYPSCQKFFWEKGNLWHAKKTFFSSELLQGRKKFWGVMKNDDPFACFARVKWIMGIRNPRGFCVTVDVWRRKCVRKRKKFLTPRVSTCTPQKFSWNMTGVNLG